MGREGGLVFAPASGDGAAAVPPSSQATIISSARSVQKTAENRSRDKLFLS
jgi:hypothetical protein